MLCGLQDGSAEQFIRNCGHSDPSRWQRVEATGFVFHTIKESLTMAADIALGKPFIGDEPLALGLVALDLALYAKGSANKNGRPDQDLRIWIVAPAVDRETIVWIAVVSRRELIQTPALTDFIAAIEFGGGFQL